MTKTLNQLGEATDLDTPDLLLTLDTSTGDLSAESRDEKWGIGEYAPET